MRIGGRSADAMDASKCGMPVREWCIEVGPPSTAGSYSRSQSGARSYGSDELLRYGYTVGIKQLRATFQQYRAF
jgi:hypothetical protein